MHKTYFNFLLIFLVGLGGCMSTGYIVESDYSYYGKFSKYSSYDFITTPESAKDTIIGEQLLRDAIIQRLKVQGYKLTTKKPNLLISYKVFYKDLRFQGYQQPNIEKWSKYELEEESYDPIKYSLREGTLLITLWDRKRERSIWQGYASGLFGNQLFDNERHLKRAVRNIFDQYNFLAEGFESTSGGE